jgi:hypothetical protein
MLNRVRCAGFAVASWLAVFFAPSFGALSLTSLSHSENFDFLASTGTANAWDDDQGSRSTSGSPGWWWIGDNATGYDASNGSSSAPDRTSFGPVGDSERAMGSLTGAANDFTIWALVIENNTGVDLESLTLSFTGEQWRNGEIGTDTVVFSYMTSDDDFVDLDFLPTIPDPWTYDSDLDFTGQDRGGDNVALDGNSPANRESLSDTLVVNIPAGDFIALRWRDDSTSSLTDHGLAIDNLSITFTPTPVPEPAAILFGGLVCGIIGLGYARRKLWKRQRP